MTCNLTYVYADGSSKEVSFINYDYAIDNADIWNDIYRQRYEAGEITRQELEASVVQFIKGAKSTFCMF